MCSEVPKHEEQEAAGGAKAVATVEEAQSNSQSKQCKMCLLRLNVGFPRVSALANVVELF